MNNQTNKGRSKTSSSAKLYKKTFGNQHILPRLPVPGLNVGGLGDARDILTFMGLGDARDILTFMYVYVSTPS